jgi:hypothetical protein
MKDKGHFYSSIIKSISRIVGYIILAVAIPETLGFSLVLIGAEVIGIAEEFLDRR